MRWCDVEDGEWWVIPAEVAKNGEANRVYLSPQVRQVLRDLHAHTGGGRWVLASPYKEGAHLTTIKTANNGILARTGMRHWTPHDLRRTAASRMSSMGTDRRVLQAILNHKDHSVTAVYDRYSLDRERQEALTQWGRRVEELVGGAPKGAVVPFRGELRLGFGEAGGAGAGDSLGRHLAIKGEKVRPAGAACQRALSPLSARTDSTSREP